MDADEARRLLHAERDRLTALLGEGADDIADQLDSDQGAGDADAAKQIIDREMERSELRQLYAERQKVDEALERVEAGTYGLSEVSGEPIPDERLRAQPTATRTVEEQELADNRGRAGNVSNPDLNR